MKRSGIRVPKDPKPMKRTRLKRRYKPPKRSGIKMKANEWVRVCDSLWRKKVLMDSPRTCPVCNLRLVADAHHLIGCGFWLTRWLLKNGLGVCRECHGRPGMIMAWLEKNRPERYQWVQEHKARLRHGEKLGSGLQEVWEELQAA